MVGLRTFSKAGFGNGKVGKLGFTFEVGSRRDYLLVWLRYEEVTNGSWIGI